MKTKNIAKVFFLSAVILTGAISMAPKLSHAATISSLLSGQICTPDDTTAGHTANLGRCINNIYIVSLSVAGVVAFLMFVIAGYLYSTGTQKAVAQAKSIMGSTIAALVILFGAYAILNSIDPEFTRIPTIQTPTPDCSGLNCDTTLPGDTGAPVTPPSDTTPGNTGTGGNTSTISATAQVILDNHRIALATVHVSGVKDEASAKSNITYAAAGKQAARSNYGNAPGGFVDLNLSMLRAIVEISKKFTISISEIAGGSHSVGSRHYDGSAFDINVANGVHLTPSNTNARNLANQIVEMCRNLGATQAQYESESNHVHCAW